MNARIQIDRSKIADFCRRWNVEQLSLFGSVLREDFRADSDVDVLVRFGSDAHIGLIGFSRMEDELSELLGWKVDLVTVGGLKALIRDSVLAEAEVLYAA
ncbi:MAG: nucleotidyltransferase family protein [Armatimonadota bacterium]|nr:nucleotidyltransferase family protein [Armatimonadota bacterium]